MSGPGSMETPIHLRHRPIRQGSCLACPRRRQCPCRIYTCTQRRFPFPSPRPPSTHPPLSASSGLPSSIRGRVSAVAVWPERLPDNAGSSCGGIQSHGNNECPWETTERPRLANVLAHLPTGSSLLVSAPAPVGESGNGSTYSLHPKTPTPVHHLEKLLVLSASEPV